MARAVAFVPDLLFGSNVIGALSAEATIPCSSPEPTIWPVRYPVPMS